ncbi:MAG: hypothetical protein PHV11_01535 [Candidatus Bipolaricaulis sp.]|nr:hypothetical protein [Candidatus Bipolaricaulis sp.]MDD5647195.1 hypothetical protein [Candidatus Bipolaricaulis sp.]
MSDWRIRVWRVVGLGFVVALLIGLIVMLPAYLHMRGVAASRAAELKTLGAQLGESRMAHEAALAENRITAETLKGTAADLEELRAAQQSLIKEDRETSATLQDTATDLGQLHAAQQLALCDAKDASETMEETAVGFEELRAAQETSVAETLQATAELKELQVTLAATAEQDRTTSDALRDTATALDELRVAQQMTAQEYRETIQDLQDAIGHLATTSRPTWLGGPAVPPVTDAGPSGSDGYTAVDAGEASSLWVDGFSAAQGCPAPSSIEAAGTTSLFNDNVAAQAKGLIWKHLGRPPYRLFAISQTQSTVQNLWHVMGRFARSGEEAQTFAASLRYLPNGKWLLLSFCWVATNAPAGTSSTP